MGQAFELALGIPLPVGYLLATLIVLPFALYGMGAVAKMQTWTQPLWIAGLVLPFVVVLVREPGKFAEFAHFGGTEGERKSHLGRVDRGRDPQVVRGLDRVVDA